MRHCHVLPSVTAGQIFKFCMEFMNFQPNATFGITVGLAIRSPPYPRNRVKKSPVERNPLAFLQISLFPLNSRRKPDCGGAPRRSPTTPAAVSTSSRLRRSQLLPPNRVVATGESGGGGLKNKRRGRVGARRIKSGRLEPSIPASSGPLAGSSAKLE